MLNADQFPAFFAEVYGEEYEPFPWQQRLAQQACSGHWPSCIALPTASGKTACVDVAVFALACQAELPPGQRTAPRRIFFVVDRRVIVEEAFERANSLATKLAEDTTGVCREVADALRRIARTGPDDRPLDVYQLRGGIYRDDAWVRSPLQPTVIASTVDQVGSRLLFRGYGVSDSAKPIHAALIGNDSLIVLDEAHCAQPFRETLLAVSRYRSAAWARESLGLPFQFVEMSATPRDEEAPFALAQADLEHPILSARQRAAKPAALRVAQGAKGKGGLPKLAQCLCEQAEALANHESGPKAIAIIVNRVRTARLLHESLRKKHDGRTHLMIGRMRPTDRDRLTRELQAKFASKADRGQLDQPHFVVATQCLEVGADFDFDAMICECASLDALRQRFGRLNRMGRDIQALAAVVIAEGDIAPKEPDPIYGDALPETWQWLTGDGQRTEVDFGISAMDPLWQRACAGDPELPGKLQAPAPHAPVMLPAHVDSWCQTSPMSTPDPDIALFLHGPNRGQPEVQVCWRADLSQAPHLQVWTQAVSLCPPVSTECLAVPLWLIRQWLFAETPDYDTYSDVIGGQPPAAPEATCPQRQALLWRGPDRSVLAVNPSDIRPGDTLVLPVTAGGWATFGHLPDAPPDSAEGHEPAPQELRVVDLADTAFRRYRDKAILRLHPNLWPTGDAFAELREWAANPEENRRLADLRILLRQTADLLGNAPLTKTLRALADPRNGLVVNRYAGSEGGAVLSTRRRLGERTAAIAADDGDDTTSIASGSLPVPLSEHLQGVAHWAEAFAEDLAQGDLRRVLVLAARSHDLGKADPRFQAYVTQSPMPDAELWAKHPRGPASYEEHRRACARSGRPEGWRHELLSVAMLQHRLRPDLPGRDILLHVLAAHHGYCRPFAPVAADPAPVNVAVRPDGTRPDGTSGTALSASSNPGLERLDSGVAERFWQLTRRYGWWGLPYLEAVLRLADWKRSADESQGIALPSAAADDLASCLEGEPVPITGQGGELLLPGIDGANPLGFLAALGTLRILSLAWPDRHVGMSWRQNGGAWRPVLHSAPSATQDELIETLHDHLCSANRRSFSNPHLDLGKNLSVPPTEFRQHALAAALAACPNDRRWADFVVSFGSEALTHAKLDRIDYTQFCFLAGSGHQDYLDTAGKLCATATADHLRSTLFAPWTYDDERLSMRWDPIEAREYAHRWGEPSKEPTRTVWGANLLAFEGTALYPTVPATHGLPTAGFTQGHGSRQFSWPLWDIPLAADVVGSLARHPALRAPTPSRESLAAIGVVVIQQSDKVRIGEGANYKWNFRPARAL